MCPIDFQFGLSILQSTLKTGLLSCDGGGSIIDTITRSVLGLRLEGVNWPKGACNAGSCRHMCDRGKRKKKTVNKSNGRRLIVKGSGSSPACCSRGRREEKVSASASHGGERAREGTGGQTGQVLLER